MTLSDLIRTRRSLKSFAPGPVSRDLIAELLDTAVYAPNHRLTEPWRFVVGDGEARNPIVDELVKIAVAKGKDFEKTRSRLANVPMFLFVIMRENVDPLIREEDVSATSCVVDNFLLLAWERGLGTSWKTFTGTSELRQLVGLADDERVIGFLHVGYPPPEAPAERSRMSARERLTFLG